MRFEKWIGLTAIFHMTTLGCTYLNIETIKFWLIQMTETLYLQKWTDNGCMHRKLNATHVSIESFISWTVVHRSSESQETFIKVILISWWGSTVERNIKWLARFTDNNSGYLASTLWMFSLILKVFGIVSSG